MGMSACDLDLRLRLGEDDGRAINSGRMLGLFGRSEEEQHQQMTMFYRGRICVWDTTEIKARAIISMARREMDDQIMKKKKKTAHEEEEEEGTSGSSSIFQTPSPEKVLMNPDLPMKRSLQRFLQKRKSRLATNAVSHPYTASAAAARTKSQVAETSAMTLKIYHENSYRFREHL